MVSALEFANRIRTLLDLDVLPWISLFGTEADDPECCVVATALGAAVGEATSGAWGDAGWVMRFPDAATARVVGIVAGLPWVSGCPEVPLPEPLIDLAVSHHFGYVLGDDLGQLIGWVVPDTSSEGWALLTATEPLIEADLGLFRSVS